MPSLQSRYGILIMLMMLCGAAWAQDRDHGLTRQMERLRAADGLPQAEALADSLLRALANPEPRFEVLMALAKRYNEDGKLTAATEKARLALREAKLMADNEAQATAHYHLGEFALRSGNLNDFEYQTRKAFAHLERTTEAFEMGSRILNYMGAVSYLTGKADSALIYYRMALDEVESMDANSENQLYFPAAVKANMVLLLQHQNKYEEAMQLAKECIVLNQRFLKEEPEHPLRFRAVRNLSLAYRNLASLYEQVGDHRNTHVIAQWAYNHAKKHLDPNVLEYFSAITLLAEAKIALRKYGQASLVLQEAEQSLNGMDGENALLWANFYTISARINYDTGNYRLAQQQYEKGDRFHEEAHNNSVSSDRVFALMNLSLCYARTGQLQQAYRLLDRHYRRLSHGRQPVDTRLANALLTTKARAASIAGDYAEVLNCTNLFLVNNPTRENPAVNVFVPEMLTLNAEAKYALNKERDMSFLKEIEQLMQKALASLDERQAIFITYQRTEDLIQQHLDVFHFAKRIALELYQGTGETHYLERLLNIHESSMYNRLRSRLGLRNITSTFKLPPAVLARETALRDQLVNDQNSVEQFIELSADWQLFLDSLREAHPEYYKLRYANVSVPLRNLREQVPAETTVLRYFFIDNRLFVYVLGKDTQKLVPLASEHLNEWIREVSTFGTPLETVSQSLHNLHSALWLPIASEIKTRDVIILPDRELFNLSFEALAAVKVKSYSELATESLLARHNISYQYSLKLIGVKKQASHFEGDVVAFAPEFDAPMKSRYLRAISDSLFLDKAYLTLLPQPFSSALVKRISEKFDGRSFLNESASKQSFTRRAKNHKIIHIGTHAESDNVNPEHSRLVFAKNLADSLGINDNYLYAYEIYDQDLRSNLAILTACETGRPGYQPGEGMISLAHAFNYAGSESILTGLWQIDEQSSAAVLESFYGYLANGLTKSEALRRAKLDYLGAAKGRTRHPHYWAGLTLMGDTSAIAISQPLPWYVWTLLALGIAAFTALVVKRWIFRPH